MNRKFINSIYGVYSDEPPWHRRGRMDYEIGLFLENNYIDKDNFVTYVFGDENYRGLKKLGVKNLVKISDNPVPHGDFIYRTKFDVWKYAMEEDGYDEIIYLDWDTIAFRKVTDEIWDILNQKEVIQSNLTQYRREVIYHRKMDRKYLANGGFVYMRDKTLPSRLIDGYNMLVEKYEKDGFNLDGDEPTISYVMDEISGGWAQRMPNGLRRMGKYLHLFEPEACMLKRFVNVMSWEYHRKCTDKLFFIHQSRGKPTNDLDPNTVFEDLENRTRNIEKRKRG